VIESSFSHIYLLYASISKSVRSKDQFSGYRQHGVNCQLSNELETSYIIVSNSCVVTSYQTRDTSNTCRL